MVSESNQLPEDAASLKQIIFSLQQQNDHLQEMVRLLQNEIFGRKSEVRPVIDPNQLPLFTADRNSRARPARRIHRHQRAYPQKTGA